MTRQCVFITGGSSGIGLGLARWYAGAGDDVVLLARDPGKLDEAVADCRAVARDPGQTIAGQSLDVSDRNGLPGAMERLVQQFGLPDLLILSAGIVTNKTFLDTATQEWDRVMDVNLTGCRDMARAVLPAMLARGSGQITFISSMGGLIGGYGYTAYCASKFALNGFVQALHMELDGTGVSPILVCPGEVDTPMIQAEAATILPQTRFIKDRVSVMPADDVARKIARGIGRNQALVIPGLQPRAMAFAARVFPGMFRWVLKRLLRSKFGSA